MSKFYIHNTSIIDEKVKIGKGTKIWHWCHLSSNVRIGNNCILGQNVFIGKNVKIGNNVKIQNNVSIYEGVTVRDDVLLDHQLFLQIFCFPEALKIKKKSS